MILPYVARLDPFGFEAKHHQGWAPTNWLRLIDCPACGDHRYRVIIGDVIIAELGHRLGGWEKDG